MYRQMFVYLCVYYLCLIYIYTTTYVYVLKYVCVYLLFLCMTLYNILYGELCLRLFITFLVLCIYLTSSSLRMRVMNYKTCLNCE